MSNLGKSAGIAWFCLLGIFVSPVHAWQSDNGNGTYDNPPLFADYPDPDIVRVTNDFYLVSTTFADSPGINVLHSKDLVNWEIVGHCATNLNWSGNDNLIGGTAYRQGFWAGGIRYYNGTFYVVANPTGANGRIYYATNAAGPWQYYQLNQSLYDPGLLIDTNGTGYIVYGYSPQQSVATLSTDFSRILSVSNNVVLSGGEGSHAVRVGNFFYLFNANPGVWPYQLLCSRATNIFGPWQTNHVCLTETTGGHQGSIVDLDNTGTNYYGFVMKDSGAIGRLTFLCPIFWTNGWPVWGTNGAGVPSVAAKPIRGEPIMQPATSDEFTNTTLGPQWQWNHNPDNTKWSLSSRPGYLRLMPTQATNFWVARNSLTQKGQGPWSRGEVGLDVSSLQPGDICGLGTLGTTNGQIAIDCDLSGNKHLTMNVIVPTTNSLGLSVFQTNYGSLAVPGTNVYLRVDLDFNASLGTCSYSFDDTNWDTLGPQFNLAYDMSVGTFQGEKFAVFCYNPNPGTGWLDVDYFHFSNNLQRGRPHLNAARTTFVADDGQLLRGPYTSTEWTPATSAANLAAMKTLGFNAIHLYAEDFNTNYPAAGSTAPGYSAANVDALVAETRTNGLYLIMTVGNGGYNGDYNFAWVTNFWSFYAPRYANETHVIYEVQNEPVAWGPPYSSSSATPTGAVNMEVAAYKTIRANAPNTPILLFSYSVIGGSSGALAALTDIQAYNTNLFGAANVVWTNEAVAFHGYAGWQGASAAASTLVAAGYPCFQTEFYGTVWGTDATILDAQLVTEMEYLGISWLTFLYVPPTGVSVAVTQPQSYENVVNWAGLSWNPDCGNWPPARGPYGNGGLPWTTQDFTNNLLTNTLHLEAENFDTGGQGVACNVTPASSSAVYRTNEPVDIETTTDQGGGYDVAGLVAGNWLEYTIMVMEPGRYNLKLRVAATAAGSVQALVGGINGTNLTGAWAVPATGGAQTWTTITNTVLLTPGRQVLHLGVLSGGLNLNWIELAPVVSGVLTNGTYKFLNGATALALEGLAASGTIVASNYSGLTSQQWNLRHIGGDLFEITSVADGWSWNMASGGGGSEFGLVWWWGAGSDQCYLIQPAGGGYYRFLPVVSGMSMESSLTNGSTVDQNTFSGGANQVWGVETLSAPAFPTGLFASTISSTQVNLVWNAVSGTASYNVKRSPTSGGPYSIIATGLTATNYADAGLTAGVGYFYVVSAVTSGVESLNSVEASAARLCAWLKFDESSGTLALDSTGDGWNGTLVNSPVWTTGKFGNAVSLSGTNQYVTLPAGTVDTLTNFTIAIWVKLTALNTWSRLLDFGNGTTTYMFLTPDSGSGAVRFSITTGGSGGEQQINGSAALPANTWTHVAVTVNGATGTLYVNGLPVGSNPGMTLTPAQLGVTTNNYLGKSQYADPYLNGCLDELRIYASALTPADVAALSSLQPTPVSPPAIPTGLMAAPASSFQVNLVWNASTNVSGYNLKRSSATGGQYTNIASGVAVTNYFDSGLVAGAAYYYVVSAVNASGESANSAPVSATTPPLGLGALAHRYSFNETGGTTVVDSIGGSAGNGSLPNGGTFSGGALTLSSNAEQYVNLPAGIIDTNAMAAVTIEAWAAFETNLPWSSWLFGFGNVSSGTGGNCLFCSEGGGRFAASALNPSYLGETNAYAAGFSWSGCTLHLACVFNPPGGVVALYTNGILAGTNLSGVCTMSSIVDHESYINRSLYSTDPYVNLTLAEFRIYGRALNAAEVAATDALGPDEVLSTATPSVHATVSGSTLTLSWPLASAGFTVQSCTNLAAGHWIGVSSLTPQMNGSQWTATIPVPGAATATYFRLLK